MQGVPVTEVDVDVPMKSRCEEAIAMLAGTAVSLLGSQRKSRRKGVLKEGG